jgi:hypothetical protein
MCLYVFVPTQKLFAVERDTGNSLSQMTKQIQNVNLSHCQDLIQISGP